MGSSSPADGIVYGEHPAVCRAAGSAWMDMVAGVDQRTDGDGVPCSRGARDEDLGFLWFDAPVRRSDFCIHAVAVDGGDAAAGWHCLAGNVLSARPTAQRSGVEEKPADTPATQREYAGLRARGRRVPQGPDS